MTALERRDGASWTVRRGLGAFEAAKLEDIEKGRRPSHGRNKFAYM